MIPSTPSSAKLELENTFQELFSLILSQLLLMKSVLEPTDNSSIQNNWSQEKKMPLTTMPVVTTPSEKKSSILSLTESENLPINVPVFKVSLSSTLSVVVPDPDSLHC